jgi:hypothetical protein
VGIGAGLGAPLGAVQAWLAAQLAAQTPDAALHAAPEQPQLAGAAQAAIRRLEASLEREG